MSIAWTILGTHGSSSTTSSVLVDDMEHLVTLNFVSAGIGVAAANANKNKKSFMAEPNCKKKKVVTSAVVYIGAIYLMAATHLKLSLFGRTARARQHFYPNGKRMLGKGAKLRSAATSVCPRLFFSALLEKAKTSA